MKKVGPADWRTSNGLPSASDPETEADRTPRESSLACMTANREPSNQSFEIDREATVCTASRRFLPLCGRETARTRGTSLPANFQLPTDVRFGSKADIYAQRPIPIDSKRLVKRRLQHPRSWTWSPARINVNPGSSIGATSPAPPQSALCADHCEVLSLVVPPARRSSEKDRCR